MGPDRPRAASARGATTSLAVFTRDLRVHDNPTLAGAVADNGLVVPVFVHYESIERGRPRRAERDAYLDDALADLDRSLRQRGAGLVRCRGRWEAEVVRLAARVGALRIHVARDVTPYARRRLARLEAAAGSGVQVVAHDDTIPLVRAGVVTPTSAGSGSGDRADHYKVFTPYYRRWSAVPWRPVIAAPRRVDTVRTLEGLSERGRGGRLLALDHRPPP